MKLVAAMMVADGELRDRYLQLTVPMLLEFCDEVRLLIDPGCRDDVGAWAEQYRHVWTRHSTARFFDHEGRARQQLLDFTLEGKPDWVLAIDADETVADGPRLRAHCEQADVPAVSLCLWEVWSADPDGLFVRQDGGWAEHEAPIVWTPGRLPWRLSIPDKALASGRVPSAVRGLPRTCAGSLLHWGWTRQAERVDRHARYAVADGGRYHASHHLDSILWGADRVRGHRAAWPDTLAPWQDRLLEAVNRP